MKHAMLMISEGKVNHNHTEIHALQFRVAMLNFTL